jgi:hypothetical protein
MQWDMKVPDPPRRGEATVESCVRAALAGGEEEYILPSVCFVVCLNYERLPKNFAQL